MYKEPRYRLGDINWRRGSSLVEVLAAVALLTMVACSIIPIYRTTSLWLEDAGQIIQGAGCAYAAMEYVRSTPGLLDDGAVLALPAETLDNLLPGSSGYSQQGCQVRVDSCLYNGNPDLYLTRVLVTWSCIDKPRSMELYSIVYYD